VPTKALSSIPCTDTPFRHQRVGPVLGPLCQTGTARPPVCYIGTGSEAHAALGNIEAAMAVAGGITNAAQESYANHSIALALAEVGDFESAKVYIKRITQVRMLMAYRQIAKLLAKAKKLSELLRWIRGLPAPAARVCLRRRCGRHHRQESTKTEKAIPNCRLIDPRLMTVD
jgi:hypothetical protein